MDFLIPALSFITSIETKKSQRESFLFMERHPGDLTLMLTRTHILSVRVKSVRISPKQSQHKEKDMYF